MANSKHRAWGIAVLISSFPHCEGTGGKFEEIRKQSLENWYFKELPRKNQWCFPPFSFSPHGKSYRGAGCPRSPGNNILSAYVMGSALTNPRTPAQNDQSSQVKNESNFIKIGSLVATSQQLHKQPLKKTALQVSEFNPCENQPALWV